MLLYFLMCNICTGLSHQPTSTQVSSPLTVSVLLVMNEQMFVSALYFISTERL